MRLALPRPLTSPGRARAPYRESELNMENEMRICIIDLALGFSKTMTQANRLGVGRPFPHCCPLLEIAAKCEQRFNHLAGLFYLSLEEYEALTNELIEYQSVVFFRT